MRLGLAECGEPILDFAERGIHCGHRLPGITCLVEFIDGLVGPALLEAERKGLFIAELARIECFLEIAEAFLCATAIGATDAHHVKAIESPSLARHRRLELGDGVVDEAHFPIGNTEVVVGLVIAFTQRLTDALLELLEDGGKAIVLGRETHPDRGAGRTGVQGAAELRSQVEVAALGDRRSLDRECRRGRRVECRGLGGHLVVFVVDPDDFVNGLDLLVANFDLLRVGFRRGRDGSFARGQLDTGGVVIGFRFDIHAFGIDAFLRCLRVEVDFDVAQVFVGPVVEILSGLSLTRGSARIRNRWRAAGCGGSGIATTCGGDLSHSYPGLGMIRSDLEDLCVDLLGLIHQTLLVVELGFFQLLDDLL